MGDRRKCQTYDASPAEPGGLPVMLGHPYKPLLFLDAQWQQNTNHAIVPCDGDNELHSLLEIEKDTKRFPGGIGYLTLKGRLSGVAHDSTLLIVK